ncbi:MAG TPA: protein kinase [Methylomirabilota bacterium]|nr:protein kinase [Methylomirabilota bacterium]
MAETKDRPTYRIPDHELLRCIGEGAYGEVWLARNIMGTYRAVKFVFRDRFKEERPYLREYEGLKNFERISRRHSGLVDVLQVGRNDAERYFYYIMELGDDEEHGQDIRPDSYSPRTLQSTLARCGRMTFDECLRVGLILSDALEFLHGQGLVHRDVKPSNVIFVDGLPKLADVGLVAEVNRSSTLTLVGSPDFMPKTGGGTAAGDIYGFGKVLYLMSTGQSLSEFPGLPTLHAEEAIAEGIFELNEIVLKACEDDERKRYASARQLHEDLQRLQAGRSVRRLRDLQRLLARVRRYAVFSLLALVVAGSGYWVYLREQSHAAEERQRQVGGFEAYGTRAMEDGDFLGSLPWFAAALTLDEGNPLRERTHRLRIGAAMRHSPRLIQTFLGLQEFRDLAFSPDGAALLIPDHEGRAGFRRLSDGRLDGLVYHQPIPADHTLASYQLSADGSLVMYAGNANQVRLYEVNTGKLIHQIDHGASVASAALSPDNSLVVTTFLHTNSVVVNHLETGAIVHQFTSHRGFVFDVAWSHDGTMIATAGTDDATVILHDADTGREIRRITDHDSWVYSVGFSRDDQRLATSSYDKTARIFDVETGRALIPPIRHPAAVSGAELSPDGNILATACHDNLAYRWDARTGVPLTPPLRHAAKVITVRFSPDGHHLATICAGGSVRVWNLRPTGSKVDYSPASVSQDGQLLFAYNPEGHAQVRDALSNQTLSEFAIPARLAVPPILTPDGRHVLIHHETADGESFAAVVLDTRTGQTLGEPVRDSDLSTALITSDGQHLLAFSGNKASLWEVRAGRVKSSRTFEGSELTKVTMNHRGDQVALVQGKRDLLLWNFLSPDEKPLGPVRLSTDIEHVEFSPSDAYVVTARTSPLDSPESAQVWEAATLNPIGPELLHADGVLHATFSPDERRLLTCSEDFTAILWDFRTGRMLAPPLRHAEQVRRGAFDPTGLWVTTVDRDKRLQIWSAAGGEPLTPPLEIPAAALELGFLADSRTVWVRMANSKTGIWNLPFDSRDPQALVKIAQLLSAQTYHYSGTVMPEDEQNLQMLWTELHDRFPEDFAYRERTAH